MIILWDSSAMTCRLTLVDGDNTADYEWEANRTLAKNMLGYFRDTLLKHGKTLHDISGIGVMRGPGSFTGLRIGMTVLNTIANANQVPIVGAVGEQWQAECITALQNGVNHQVVLPEYGAPPTITSPKK